jgi:pimeloyl-ACP methyl ester carboxylesterase
MLTVGVLLESVLEKTRRFARRSTLLGMAGAVALTAGSLVSTRAGSQVATATPQTPGSLREVVFTQYDPLFSSAEILRRLVLPLAVEQHREFAARQHETLAPYPIDLSKERFLVYVPSTAPPAGGFALLVFISPRDSLALADLAGAGEEQPSLPPGWASQLDKYGVIFVAPAGAGNTTPVLSRRVPLALSAEENIVREYPVDRERIYVGGFSGGSRVALHVALGYPDVFRGGVLNAGSDPVGDSEYPLPPRDLLLRFQASHLVYVTGAMDTSNVALDASSLTSMREWCVFDVDSYNRLDVTHEVMSSTAFGRALALLLNRVSPDPPRLEACRSRVEAELQQKLGRAETLISTARRNEARKLLLDIDKRYGGLAAPRSVELARSCGCGLLGP